MTFSVPRRPGIKRTQIAWAAAAMALVVSSPVTAHPREKSGSRANAGAEAVTVRTPPPVGVGLNLLMMGRVQSSPLLDR